MQYRQLGSSALNVSVIGVGSLHFGVFCDEQTSHRIIHTAQDCGVNFIDTAPMYGRGLSETYVGHAIKGRRQKFIIATKVGLEPTTDDKGRFGVKTVPLTEKAIRQSVDSSLTALKTDYLDLLQLHAFDDTVTIEETFGALQKIVAEGKVTHVGCSNYNRGQLGTACEAIKSMTSFRLVSLQSHYNVIERRLEADLLPLCQQNEIGIMCYRSLARGILNNKYRIGVEPDAGTRGALSSRVRDRLTPDTLALVKKLDEVAVLRGRTCGDLAIAWAVAQPHVSSVILGMRNPEQVKVNAQASDWGLDLSDLAAIDAAIDDLGIRERVISSPDTFLET